MAARIVISLIVVLFCHRAPAQIVISKNSGLILHFDGDVSLDGAMLSPLEGRFPQLQNGSLLETIEGRIEILMAPGVLLWLGPHSTVRMRNRDLTDARMEFLTGSLLMQTAELPEGNAVTLLYRGSEIHAKANTVYRNHVSSEMEHWVRKRAQTIAMRNARAARRPKHRGGFSRPYPTAAPSFPGRT